ncbi:hypothetical protein ABEB36_009314 [Hypothenemus hampei]|uniref:Uncharacterized protein n=1 Tax=Hypothenemus hampei TaxID=57062 RepID=A0ABD1EFZ5_HYPHA
MPDSHKCERLGGVFFVWPRPPMQDDPSPSRRRDAAQHRPPTTVSPPTTTSGLGIPLRTSWYHWWTGTECGTRRLMVCYLYPLTHSTLLPDVPITPLW